MKASNYRVTSQSLQQAVQRYQATTVNITQCENGCPVSTLTITKRNNSYEINSTNNMIICSDCTRFFSIHAPACPFCGCPMSYISDYYYKKYMNRKLEIEAEQQRQEAERKAREEAERKAREEEERRRKKEEIERKTKEQAERREREERERIQRESKLREERERRKAEEEKRIEERRKRIERISQEFIRFYESKHGTIDSYHTTENELVLLEEEYFFYVEAVKILRNVVSTKAESIKQKFGNNSTKYDIIARKLIEDHRIGEIRCNQQLFFQIAVSLSIAGREPRCEKVIRDYALYHYQEIDSEKCEQCVIKEPLFDSSIVEYADQEEAKMLKREIAEKREYSGWEDLAPGFATDNYPSSYGKQRKLSRSWE